MGAALSIAGLVLLTVRAASLGSARAVVCAAIFGASAILLYLSSTLYHSLSRTRAYRVMMSLDHGSIYLLIAGTYTPFTLIGLRGPLGWTLFAIVWSCALVGVVVKAFFAGRWNATFSTAMYLVMGWLCVFAIKSMYLLLFASGLRPAPRRGPLLLNRNSLLRLQTQIHALHLAPLGAGRNGLPLRRHLDTAPLRHGFWCHAERTKHPCNA